MSARNVNVVRRRVLCAAGVLLLWPMERSRAQPASALTVGGEVSEPLTLTVDDLRKFPAVRVDDARGRGEEDRRDATPRVYAGALLRDVLDRARLVERQPRSLRRAIVVATASDGHKALFSWAELYLSPIGDGVLIVYERDGAPLPEGEGPLSLISTKDTKPGPRHVKWLKSIDVRMITD